MWGVEEKVRREKDTERENRRSGWRRKRKGRKQLCLDLYSKLFILFFSSCQQQFRVAAATSSRPSVMRSGGFLLMPEPHPSSVFTVYTYPLKCLPFVSSLTHSVPYTASFCTQFYSQSRLFFYVSLKRHQLPRLLMIKSYHTKILFFIFQPRLQCSSLTWLIIQRTV